MLVTPRVAAAMDEGQKWAVLAAGEALKDAGHPDRPIDTESTGVIVGNAMSRGNPEVEAMLVAEIPYCSMPEALMRFFMRELMNGMSRRVETDLRDDYFAHLLRLAPDFYNRSPTGELMISARRSADRTQPGTVPSGPRFSTTVAPSGSGTRNTSRQLPPFGLPPYML